MSFLVKMKSISYSSRFLLFVCDCLENNNNYNNTMNINIESLSISMDT